MKAPGTRRIVLIGDSHIFGFGVERAEATASRLEALLNERHAPAFEVLNFGVPGYNAAQAAAVFEQIALPFDPDVVVIAASSNDHEPAQVAGADGYLRTPGGSASELAWGVRALARRIRLVRFVRLLIRRHTQAQYETDRRQTDQATEWMGPVPDGPIPERLQQSVGRPLEEIIAQSRERKIAVVLAPFAGDPGYRRLFRAIARSPDVALVELLGTFPEVESWEELQARHGLRWDAHLGAEAHRRWAEALAAAMETHGFVP